MIKGVTFAEVQELRDKHDMSMMSSKEHLQRERVLEAIENIETLDDVKQIMLYCFKNGII